MKVSELKEALATAPDDSVVSVRTDEGETCEVSALHVGTGGDAAGTVVLDCTPHAEPDADDDTEFMDDVDAMATKAGVLGKKKPAPAAVPPEESDEE